MFLIAGVTPKTKLLDNNPRLCPVCGLAQAYVQRIDHYLSLFFIPVLRVKTGEAFIMCRRCERRVDEIRKEYPVVDGKQMINCITCGRSLQKDFTYCPYCGKPVLNRHLIDRAETD